MTVPVRLGGYLLILLVVLGAAFGLGRALRGDGGAPTAPEPRPATHQGM
ncbi:hypothetical protein [Streptomyces sp. SPB162]|nr:hypothetical protein [Streptomyces sp. SPB162]MDF9813726.1 hypothetical protein [Streptomyces sp. SPB162]